MRRHFLFLLLALPSWTIGCTSLKPGSDVSDSGMDSGGDDDDDDDDDDDEDAGEDARSDEGVDAADDADAGSEDCPESPEVVTVGSASSVTIIEETTRWTCAQEIHVAGTLAFEDPDSGDAEVVELVVDRGTRVVVDGADTRLVFSRGTRLRAVGTASEPVVFTRAGTTGGWGGIVILGSADNLSGENSRVPLPSSLGTYRYGGSATDHDCGELRYTRIEFAGLERSDTPERNLGAALTLASCGASTRIDRVQIHRAGEGVALYGGRVGLRRVIVSRPSSVGVSWIDGWSGSMQFVAISLRQGLAAIDGQVSATTPDADIVPPLLANVTAVGVFGDSEQSAIIFQNGGAAIVRNSILYGFGGPTISVVGTAAADRVAADDLEVTYTTFFEPGASWSTEQPNNGGFDERVAFEAGPANPIEDPLLVDPGSASHTFLSSMASANATNVGVSPAPLTSVGYRGATRPGVASDWITEAWVAFP